MTEILLHGGRCTDIPLRTGQSYELQRTVTFVMFHRPEFQFGDEDESYRLVSSDGSYDEIFHIRSARPIGGQYSGLTAHGLPEGSTFSLYKTVGTPAAEHVIYDGVRYNDLVTHETAGLATEEVDDDRTT